MMNQPVINKMWYWALVAIFSAAFPCFRCPAAEELPELRSKLADLAKQVIQVVKSKPVAVGVFSPTGLPDSNASPGIEAILTEELNLQIKEIVRRDANFEVKGEFKYVHLSKPEATSPSDQLRVIRIEVNIQDRDTGENLLQAPLSAVIDGTKSIAALAQPTVLLDADATKIVRNAEVEKAIEHPSVHVHGEGSTRVSSSSKSKYDVELLAQPVAEVGKRAAKPRAISVDNGEAIVDISRGEVYEIKIYNNDTKPVAASVSVDGLDVFQFSEDRRDDGRPKYDHYIVFPKGHKVPNEKGGQYTYDGTDIIEGWHKSVRNDPNYLSFLVTSYGEGASSKGEIVSRGKVGVIHVQFSHCQEGGASRSGNETGFGPPRKVKQQPVHYDIDPPHDFVSIRYTK